MTLRERIRNGVAALEARWLLELDLALPDVLRPAASGPAMPPRLLIRPGDQGVAISLLGPANEEVFVEMASWADYSRNLLDRCLARAATLVRPGKFLVSLAVPHAIARSLLIPRRARARATQIVQEQICRKTPLKLDDVFVACSLRTASAGRLRVQYLVLPKTLLERTLKRLFVSPAEITALESEANGDAPGQLVPFAAPVAARASATTKIALALAAVVLLAAATGFLTRAGRQTALLTELDREVVRIAEPAKQAATRLRSVYGLIEDVGRFSELRGGSGVVGVWEELARLLPASTYLTEFEVSGPELRISGFSDSAPDLVQKLEGSPVFKEASLSGPVVFDPAHSKERFSMRASLRQPRAPAEEREP